jgi:HSP20 family protein
MEVVDMSALNVCREPETRLEPFVEDFFENGFFERWDRDLDGTMWPPVDIVEETDSFILTADVPGLDKDDISINVDGRTLMISGEKKEIKRGNGKGKYFHLERGYGSFRRSFTLPTSIDEKKIEAHYKSGVLEIALKKTKESASRLIEVKVE